MPVKAPLPCGHCQVPLEQLSLEMSWRECDSSRLQELSQSFRAGDFGKSIMAAVSIISVSGTLKVDDHGHKCIEDGAHSEDPPVNEAGIRRSRERGRGTGE